jgi:uncharacterized protein with HEPN domain
VTRRATERLADISDAVERIREYVGDLQSASIDSQLVADAVVYNLLVIGEAVKSLDDSIRDADSSIPWSDIAGMRDLLTHEYFRVDAAIVERTVRRDLPALDRAVARLRSTR